MRNDKGKEPREFNHIMRDNFYPPSSQKHLQILLRNFKHLIATFYIIVYVVINSHRFINKMLCGKVRRFYIGVELPAEVGEAEIIIRSSHSEIVRKVLFASAIHPGFDDCNVRSKRGGSANHTISHAFFSQFS